MTTDAMELILGKVETFNGRVAEDAKMAANLEGVHKIILVDLEGEKVLLELKDKKLTVIEAAETIDVTVTTTADVLLGIVNKTLSPMRALLVDKTLKVEGSLEDKLRLRKLFE